MNITKTVSGDTLTIAISGRVDSNTAPLLENFIDENLGDSTNLVFDLKDMSYTSSAGLRVFLKTHKRMLNLGSMKIVNLQSDVMEVFEMTGFVDILTIE